MQRPEQRAVVLRHDIDKLPGNALAMARREHKVGIRGSYFFRVVPSVWDEGIMRQVVELGHEIGYHYEDLFICGGNRERAIRHFEKQLSRFREIYPVKTICMHGSPLSKYDNRDLWKHYNYRDFGIIGEPYFDVDFTKVLYLTDTGRRWDGGNVSVRDKVVGGAMNVLEAGRAKNDGRLEWDVGRGEVLSSKKEYKFRHTRDIIRAAEEGRLPDQIMITVHPQRWTDNPVLWARELVYQNVKNVGKRMLVKFNDRKS